MCFNVLRDEIKNWYMLKLRSLQKINSSHQNEKALSPFYHKNIFDRK